jgi:hypothetical protein
MDEHSDAVDKRLDETDVRVGRVEASIIRLDSRLDSKFNLVSIELLVAVLVLIVANKAL